MSSGGIAVIKSGLVTSVGLSAPSTCAAIRAKVTNPSLTRFIDAAGDPIMAHQVTLSKPWRGLTKLAKMAGIAIEEAVVDIDAQSRSSIPLLLCVAEKDRPGRLEGLDDELFALVQDEMGFRFATQSAVISAGRVSVAMATAQAMTLIESHSVAQVLIAATDSLLTWPALHHYDQANRLLNAKNSNGFMPGEGAAALLLSRPTDSGDMCITGVGFGSESAGIDTEEPLRADGLASAMRAALAQAGMPSHEIDYRIADMSGEQYYFKEASLALSRTLRKRNEQLDLWHPAESIGETGAVAGLACMAVGQAAAVKRYAPGRRLMLHFGNDAGQRAAVVSVAR